jgi:hypothetical protein
MIVAALALVSGCLQKDVSETWYLGPSGAVTWVVTESDVRSDAQALTDRQNEENNYRLAFERQDHPVARGFRALGLADIRTFVLRSEVPFTVRTEARGVTINVLGLRIIQQAGLTGTSTLERDGNAWVWNFTARDPHAQDVTTPMDDGLSALLNDTNRLRVVLLEGRFESAAGFTLSGDKRVATFIDPENHHEAEGADDSVVTLRLRWISGQER